MSSLFFRWPGLCFFAKDPPKSVQLIPLAITTQTSWAKQGQDWLKEGKAEFNSQKDLKGPFTLAILAEKRLPAPESKPAAETDGKQTAAPPASKEGEAKKSQNLNPKMKVTSKRLR